TMIVPPKTEILTAKILVETQFPVLADHRTISRPPARLFPSSRSRPAELCPDPVVHAKLKGRGLVAPGDRRRSGQVERERCPNDPASEHCQGRLQRVAPEWLSSCESSEDRHHVDQTQSRRIPAFRKRVSELLAILCWRNRLQRALR